MKNIAKKMMGLAALAVLTLGGVTEVKAQTTTVPSTWTSVTFNNDVRYSQWIINSRINDFYANDKHVGFGVFNNDGTQATTPVKGKSTLDYVPGLVAKAVVENVKQNAAYSWAAPWYYNMKWFCETYYNQFTDNGKKGKSQDDLNGAKMFFALKDLTASGTYADATVNGHCTTAMGTALSGLDKLNETYIIGGSASGISAETAQTLGMYGGWFHKNTYVDQMWCDGLYMGPALLAQLINEYGSYSQINTNDGEDDWDLITRLFTISWNQLYDSNTGLLYHAFTANPKDDASEAWEGISNTPGSEVYHSAAFWGRACGWYFLALVDVLEQMDAAGKANTTNFNTLKGYLNNLAAGLANYQDATTGCWYQVLDEKDAPLSGNYLESSCTAIFTAAYLKGMRLGYYTADYSTVAQKAYEGCVNQFMMFDANNDAQLIHCCASAGLGGSSNRSGSRSYYITGSDVSQRNTYTEGKVFGGFILAATEYERAYQASKAILFSTDLKASYDLQSGDGITIEACGANGAQITYQWYKDGSAVDGATSATIEPAASGSYYCKATSGTTTIQSSTTNVTVAGDDTFTPEFTTNLPATATATVGTAKTLTVAADHADGYQWYSNTTASNTGGQTISGATSASYTFTPNATGTLYYYCVATNSKATGTQSVASNVCTVTVSEAPAGPTVLYSTDFSSSDWSEITNICNSSNAANETYNGITFHSYNSTAKPFVVNQSAGTMTWCNNNMGNNYWIAIPVTGVNGSLTITVSNGNSKTNFKYVVKQETSISGNPGSGSNATEGTPATVTVNDLDKSDYVVYLGRQGSGLTTLTSITITTPAGGDTPTPTTYTVSYNMNGHGEAIADVTNVTALPDPLPSPEATGYTFGGWYTDSGLNNAANAGASISADTELYAKWTEEPAPVTNYTVKFYNGETQYGETQEIEEGSTISAPDTNPTKDGYTFKGWALESGSTVRVTFPYPIYEDVNFYAVWSNTTSGGGGGNFSATATATLSVAADASNTEITSTNASISGGSMYVSNGQTSAKNLIDQKGGEYAFTMTNNNTFFKVTLDKALIAGDKIKADIYGPKINSKNEEQPRGLWMSTATSRPGSAPTATLSVTNTSTSSDAWLTSEDYTVTTGDGICGETTFYIYRATANSTYFTDFTITTSSSGDDITLETVSDYDDFESYAGEGKTVTFKRSFNNGKWTTLVLPFSATPAQVIAAFEYPNDCEFANIKSMTVNAQGTGSISYVTTSHITANTPILAKIKPNDGLSGKEGFTANEYVFTGVTVVNPASADAVTATSNDGNVRMYGVYKNTAKADINESSFYFIAGGKFYDKSWLSNMTPFTAYIVPQTTSGNTLKGLTFEEDNATGIINLNVNPNLDSLSHREGWGESFNLAGQKVGKDYQGLKIKKGVKIIDNR